VANNSSDKPRAFVGKLAMQRVDDLIEIISSAVDKSEGAV
jgi:hypothetical protein